LALVSSFLGQTISGVFCFGLGFAMPSNTFRDIIFAQRVVLSL